MSLKSSSVPPEFAVAANDALAHQCNEGDALAHQGDAFTLPVQLPKKRGRKPLLTSSTNLSSSTDKTSKKQPASSNEVVISKQPNSKKSEHVILKPIIVHLNVTQNNSNCLLSDLSNLDHSSSFSHSDNTSNFEANFFEYTPEIEEPIGYDGNHSATAYSCINLELDSSPAHTKKNLPVLGKNCKKNLGKNILMKDFLLNDEWSERTNYWCYWDCHPFETTPFGIPLKYKNNKFHVFGCFCSLECATAYNFFNIKQNIENAWENYNLINMLSNVISHKISVNPAIDRRCLKAFGGHLSIEDFRHLSQSSTSYNVLSFPMVSVVEHVEEVNDISPHTKSMIPHLTHNYFPLNKSIINKLESNTSKIKSTLETSMNMTFSM